MIRKGQIHGVEKRDITYQVAFIANLFEVGAYAEQEGDFHPRCVSSLFLQHSRFAWAFHTGLSHFCKEWSVYRSRRSFRQVRSSSF